MNIDLRKRPANSGSLLYLNQSIIFKILILILAMRLQRYSTNIKRYPPKKLFKALSCSLDQNFQKRGRFSKI